jgi:hypothetical protein
MRVQATINLNSTTRVTDLKRVLEKIPDEAKISVSSYRGGRPGESGYSTMTFSWEI